jgi:hypothetical protein
VVRLIGVRAVTILLCWLLNVSVVLIPFSALHAHLRADEGRQIVHGGHGHELPHAHHAAADHDVSHGEGDDADVVDLQPTLTSYSSTFSFWSHWLPLVCAIVVLACTMPLILSLLRPPRASHAPHSSFFLWRPPLRGPPTFSIHAI